MSNNTVAIGLVQQAISDFKWLEQTAPGSNFQASIIGLGIVEKELASRESLLADAALLARALIATHDNIDYVSDRAAEKARAFLARLEAA